MTTLLAARIVLAPPSAVCAACAQRCDGELVETAPGPDGEAWYLHRSVEGCEAALGADVTAKGMGQE